MTPVTPSPAVFEEELPTWQRLAISALVVATLALPFWIPYQRYPIQSFYQEWAASTLALIASLLIAIQCRKQQFGFPASAWIPLALLPSVLIHLLIGPHVVLHPYLFHLIWISLALLLMMIGRKLTNLRLQAPLADLLGGGLMVGGLASSVFEVYVRIQGGTNNAWATAGGILGQANHNGLYLWMGVVGASRLYLRSRGSRLLLLVGIAILVEAAVNGGSRSIYLYAAGGLMLSIWAAYRAPDKHSRWPLLVVGIFPILLLLSVSGLRSWLTSGPATLARYSATTVAQDGRIGLWTSAWRIMGDHPLLGAGPGTFMRESWLISAALPPDMPNSLPSTHAHNLFLQLGAELGAPTAIAVYVLIAYWLIASLREKHLSQNWIFVALPLAVLTHNQVEYSLWYLSFLVPTALCMGAASNAPVSSRFGGSSILISATAAIILSLSAGADYRKLEEILYPRPKESANALALIAETSHPLFGAYASSELAAYLPPSDRFIQFQFKHLQRALYVAPLPTVVPHRYAAVLEKLGRSREAEIEKLIADRQISGMRAAPGVKSPSTTE